MTRIKICGLKRSEDIGIVNELLPDYGGFIINFPKSHRNLTPMQVRRLTEKLDRNHILAVGVFVDRPVEEVAELLNDGTLDLAQLHGGEDEKYIRNLRELTDRKIIKAFTVHDQRSLERAARCGADHILLDQGQGSGVTFDWSVLESPAAVKVFGTTGLPRGEWFLAGGLNEENIAGAVRRFKPYGVDLSSAAETNQIKDREKVGRLIQKVRNADKMVDTK